MLYQWLTGSGGVFTATFFRRNACDLDQGIIGSCYSEFQLFCRYLGFLKASTNSQLHLALLTPFLTARKYEEDQKSLEKLNPDMLVVLGDISANGWKSTNKQWFSVLHQFQDMLGPIGVPLYIVVGDRDVGGCSETNRLVDCAANNLPGLESTACGSFSVNSVDFVSLDAIALACDRDDLRFSVERVIETESTELLLRHQEEEETNTVELQQEMFQDEEANGFGACEEVEATSEEEAAVSKEQFLWRQNAVPAGSGPVVLLHLPLHRTDDRDCTNIDIPKCSSWHRPSHNCQKSRVSSDLGNFKHEYYQQDFNVLSNNATEYVLNALKPRSSM